MVSLTATEIETHLRSLAGWRVTDGKLCKVFRFPDYYATMAFVNAVAWISHRLDHHPELLVGYDTCRVEYVTHAVGGLTERDFLCADKVDRLFEH